MFRQKMLSVLLLAAVLLEQSSAYAQAATLCDHAQFVSDITVPDGSSYTPGTAFTKTWRLKNIGTCTWTTTYKVVFTGGDQMGAPVSVNLPAYVGPGKTVDISVKMTAPAASGHYKGLWKISNAAKVQFGIGSTASDAFWVDINVMDNKAVVYDFVTNAPYAQWKSGAGTLPYPVAGGDDRGYAYSINNPHLEDDSLDSLPGLMTVPQNKAYGYIQATYPEIEIQKGDQLQTLVSCEFAATSCYVTFRIDYRLSSGTQSTLWSWAEAYDKKFYRKTINLDSLAGKKVKFVFMVSAGSSPNGDRAIWGSPRLIRAGTSLPPAPPPTLTLLPPLTPTITPYASPPPTIAPAGCNKATFVTDVTVPDGTLFAPYTAFIKTWRLKNSGTCTWTTAYKLVFYNGDQMGAPTSISLPRSVSPGTTIDLTVNMTAPFSAGTYRGYWILTNAGGTLFGLGADASKPIWVEVKVSGTSTVSGYDFAANACSAQWKSGAGVLPCPGTEGDLKGYVISKNSTQLEDGTMGPAPSLLVAPEYKYNGYIQGTYPLFTVQAGDHFRGNTGCAYGSSCYVTFRLDYMTALGTVKTFWSWRESNDKKNNTFDVNLSPLAGQNVRFILTLLATGYATNDKAVWTAPYIVRLDTSGQIPPTPVSTNTPITMPGNLEVAPTIGKLHMLDAYNGWATGEFYVLRTNNGGKTWYDVLHVTGNGYFPNVSRGWVLSGNTLYRTTDGGATWTQNEVPFSGGGYIQFINDANGFVLTGQPTGMQKHPVTLYQTTDGGVTWTMKYTNDPLNPATTAGIPFSGYKSGMTFRDTLRGWIGGSIPTPGFVYLYKTLDSGTTWAQQTLSLPYGYSSADITGEAPKFFTANDGVLPVWMTLDVGKRDLFLYVTRDGGNTWTRSTSYARNAQQTDIISMTNAISWDWGNVLRVTRNAGASWTTVTPNIKFGDGFRELDFVSATTGWARLQLEDGHTSLYRTTDGGSTWTELFGHNIPTPTPAPTPAAFAQSLVDTLNARNFDALPAMMDQSLGFAYWQSQGTSYPTNQAIDSLRTGLTVTLLPNTGRDLNSLLGGSNPYQIMGLDPAKSYGLFVSGWGSNPNSEAILYVTQRADGSLYWHSILIAPTGFMPAAPTSTPAALSGPYAVVNVGSSDVLNIRSGAGVSNSIVGYYPPDATDVMRTGPSTSADGAVWVEIRRNDGLTGWVNSYYLTEYVTHESFCADSRVLPLIEQAKQSMTQSNGSLLGPIVSPVHGVNMHLWAYGPGINFTQGTAANIYADTTVYNWGGGPSGMPDTGTFNTMVKPKYLDVFNAPNRETYCDDLTKVFPLSHPWPYPNIRYYNLYKPASDQFFDFRTLLVGIEYINGKPYIYGMVTIIWEP